MIVCSTITLALAGMILIFVLRIITTIEESQRKEHFRNEEIIKKLDIISKNMVGLLSFFKRDEIHTAIEKKKTRQEVEKKRAAGLKRYWEEVKKGERAPPQKKIKPKPRQIPAQVALIDPNIPDKQT